MCYNWIQGHLSLKDPCNIANPDSADNSTYLACSEGISGGWNATVMPCPGRETYFYERLGECKDLFKLVLLINVGL